jgi:hypothetical protein
LVNALGYDNANLKELDVLSSYYRYDCEVTISSRQFMEAIVLPHNEDILCGIYKLSSRSINTIKCSVANIYDLDAIKTDSSVYS